MDDNKIHTHEMNTCEISVPVLVFGNGKQKAMNIIDEDGADGVALLVSKLDDQYSVNDNSLYENKVNKPYFMLYFRDGLFIDQMISALCDVKNRLIRKSRQ